MSCFFCRILPITNTDALFLEPRWRHTAYQTAHINLTRFVMWLSVHCGDVGSVSLGTLLNLEVPLLFITCVPAQQQWEHKHTSTQTLLWSCVQETWDQIQDLVKLFPRALESISRPSAIVYRKPEIKFKTLWGWVQEPWNQRHNIVDEPMWCIYVCMCV